MAVGLVESWGLKPVTYPSATAVHPRAAYLSGDDRVRADDVQQAWCDPDIAGDLLHPRRLRRRTHPRPARPRRHGGRRAQAAVRQLRHHGPARVAARAARRADVVHPDDGHPRMVDDDVASPTRCGPPCSTRSPAASGPLRTAVTLVEGQAEGTLIGGNLSLLSMTHGARNRPPARQHRLHRAARGLHRGDVPDRRLPHRRCCARAGSTASPASRSAAGPSARRSSRSTTCASSCSGRSAYPWSASSASATAPARTASRSACPASCAPTHPHVRRSDAPHLTDGCG